jgi:hypothetical protein
MTLELKLSCETELIMIDHIKDTKLFHCYSFCLSMDSFDILKLNGMYSSLVFLYF